MRYRRLDENNEYSFGQNSQDFTFDANAVKQAVYTRLKLLYAEWWEDLEDGFPYFQQIAGKPGNTQSLQAVDLVIRERIINTPGVVQIIAYEGAFNHETRQYSVYTKINTEYGDFELEVAF